AGDLTERSPILRELHEIRDQPELHYLLAAPRDDFPCDRRLTAIDCDDYLIHMMPSHQVTDLLGCSESRAYDRSTLGGDIHAIVPFAVARKPHKAISEMWLAEHGL